MRNLNTVELELISGGVTAEEQQALDDAIFGPMMEQIEEETTKMLENMEFPEY